MTDKLNYVYFLIYVKINKPQTPQLIISSQLHLHKNQNSKD